MKVALRIRWPRSRLAGSPFLWVPLALLWVSALWPVRHPGVEWLEFALGAVILVGSHEVLRRGLASCWLRLELSPDLLPALAAGLGFSASFLTIVLHAAGRLPPGLVDPRGGPLCFLAEASSILFARLLMPSIAYGAPKENQDPRQPANPWRGVPRPVWLALAGAVCVSSAVAVEQAVRSGSFSSALPRLTSALLAILGAVSIDAILATRAERVPEAVFIRRRGVLTKGEPRVKEVVPFSDAVRGETLLHLASVVEFPVVHPIREAILRRVQSHFPTVPRAPDIRHIPSRGLRASFQGREILLGNVRLFRESGWPERDLEFLEQKSRDLSRNGETVIFLSSGDELRGAITLEDPIRTEAGGAVTALQELGAQVHLLSGDSAHSAEGLLRSFLEPEAEGVVVHAGLTEAEEGRVVDEWKASGRSFALCSPDPATPRRQRGASASPRSALARFVAAQRSLVRRRSAQNALAWATLAYEAGAVIFLAGALEPWLDAPPLPVAAGMIGAAAPLILSFVFEKVITYNRAFAKAKLSREIAPQRAQPCKTAT